LTARPGLGWREPGGAGDFERPAAWIPSPTLRSLRETSPHRSAATIKVLPRLGALDPRSSMSTFRTHSNSLSSACAAALIVIAGLAASTAHAEGLYVGGSLGTPKFQDPVNGISGSGSGLAGKLFIGDTLTSNFAIEAGLAKLGRIKGDAGDVKAHAEFVDAVGILPLSQQVALHASLGLAHVSLDTPTGNASGNGLKLGLGAQYALSRQLALRADWERYRPSAFGTKPNIDQFTVGAQYSF
jgi:OOP family OmpA-OmpF porin